MASSSVSSPAVSYSNILQNNKPNNTLQSEIDLQHMQFIPPFTLLNYFKDFKDSSKLQLKYNECVSSILQQFPENLHPKLTISKTFFKNKDGKILHSISVISPPEAKATYVRIRTQGLQIQNRTVFPIKRVKLDSSIQYFPKKLKIKFTNLPIICDDINVKKLIELPSEIQHEDALMRDQDTFGSVYCYNGKATLNVIISNSEQETTLREWSYKARTSGGFVWNSVIVGYHIPSLHHCEQCAAAKKLSQGHHKDWCSFAAKNKSEKTKMLLPENNPLKKIQITTILHLLQTT